MHVYLVHAESTDRYKIGITARTIAHRMNELNGSQSAYPLRLVTYIRNPKYKDVEHHLHEKYKQFRRHGEWFEFNNHQLAEVQKYLSGFDTPLSSFKPILKPKTENQPSIGLPKLSLDWIFNLQIKKWIAPMLIASGILLAYHSYSSSPSMSDRHAVSTASTPKPKNLTRAKFLRKNKRITGKMKNASKE